MQTIKISSYNGSVKNNPKKIIIHSMSEYVEYQGGFFHAPDFLNYLELSAHAIILPSGLVIRQREDTEGAYHAKGYNKDSLGVEFLVSGAHDYNRFLESIKIPYLTYEQKISGYILIEEWCRKYKLTRNDIYRHSDVDPKRKKDPGIGFEFKDMQMAVRNGI